MSEAAGEFPAWSTDRDYPLDHPVMLGAIQAKCPVSRVRLWDGSTPWVITRYADVKTILSDTRLSANFDLDGYPPLSPAALARKGTGARTFPNMDDPEHATVRRRLIADFTVRKAEALRPKLQEAVNEMIDHLLDAPRPADLVKSLARPVPTMIICEVLGVPYADREFFHRLVDTLHDHDAAPAEVLAADRQTREYLGALVDVKNTEPDHSLLGRLAVEQFRKGNMSRNEIANVGQVLMSAGQDMTTNMIALSVLAVLENPGQLAEIRDTDDPGFIAGAVEELLRYLGPSPSGRRRVATADIELGGQVIRKGDGIIVANNIANRDEAAFPDPDTVDFHRDARGHVTFGYGTHLCIGQSLARMELQVVCGTLFRRIPALRLAIPFSELRFTLNTFTYGVYELPVTW
jgi:cytochrome P450